MYRGGRDAKGAGTDGPVSLVLSLLFGAAQVVVGGAVALRLLSRKPWRVGAPFFLLLICLWFVCSGFAELAVSGMEFARSVGGAPSARAVAVWRGRVDTLLLLATVTLSLSLVARFVLVRLLSRAVETSDRRQA